MAASSFVASWSLQKSLDKRTKLRFWFAYLERNISSTWAMVLEGREFICIGVKSGHDLLAGQVPLSLCLCQWREVISPGSRTWPWPLCRLAPWPPPPPTSLAAASSNGPGRSPCLCRSSSKSFDLEGHGLRWILSFDDVFRSRGLWEFPFSQLILPLYSWIVLRSSAFSSLQWQSSPCCRSNPIPPSRPQAAAPGGRPPPTPPSPLPTPASPESLLLLDLFMTLEINTKHSPPPSQGPPPTPPSQTPASPELLLLDLSRPWK